MLYTWSIRAWWNDNAELLNLQYLVNHWTIISLFLHALSRHYSTEFPYFPQNSRQIILSETHNEVLNKEVHHFGSPDTASYMSMSSPCDSPFYGVHHVPLVHAPDHYYRLQRWDPGCSGSSGATVGGFCPVRRHPTRWNWCSCTPRSPHWNLNTRDQSMMFYLVFKIRAFCKTFSKGNCS